MRGWQRFGVVVAVAVAVAVSTGVATAPREAPAQAAELAVPTEVSLVLESDGVSLRVAHGALSVAIEF